MQRLKNIKNIKNIFLKEEKIIDKKVDQNENYQQDDDKMMNETHLVIDRSLYNQRVFDKELEEKLNFEGYSPIEELKETFHKNCFCGVECAKKQLFNRLPIIKWMKTYKFKDNILSDILTGLTIGVIHIPQGMAYSLLATLPPIYGLFTSFFAPLIYMIFGTSRHLSFGTFAFASLMVGRLITRLNGIYIPTATSTGHVNGTNLTNGTMGATNDLAFKIEMAKVMVSITVTFWVGLVQLIMCVLQLGFITTFFAEPLVNALTTGVAVQVVVSQLKSIFGVNVKTYSGNFNLPLSVYDFITKIPQINVVTLIISAICITFLMVMKIHVNDRFSKRLLVPIPIELIVVIFGTVISYAANFNSNFKVPIVGTIPAGFHAPQVPDFSLTSEIITDAFIIAIVTFATNISQGYNFSRKHQYKLNSNQELMAYGLSNMGTAIFSGFANAASLARSSVQDNAGGKTQLVSFFSCSLVCIVLVALAPLFKTLPNACLGAIILASLKGVLMQVTQLKYYWKVNKLEFLLWLVTFLAVVILDVDIGLGIGVGFYVISFFLRSSRPYITLIGNIPNTEFYKDIKVYKKAREIQGVKIIRMEHSIHAINAVFFKKSIYQLSGLKPEEFLAQLRKYEKSIALTENQLKENNTAENPRENKTEQTPNDAVIQIVQEETSNITETLEDGTERSIRTIRLKSIAPEVPLNINMINQTSDQTNERNTDVIYSVQDLEMKVYNQTPYNMESQRPKPPIHHLIIDCSPINYIDSVGVKTLNQLIKDYKEIRVTVYLAECRDAFISRVRVIEDASGTPLSKSIISPTITHLTVHDAVIHALLGYQQHPELFYN